MNACLAYTISCGCQLMDDSVFVLHRQVCHQSVYPEGMERLVVLCGIRSKNISSVAFASSDYATTPLSVERGS